MILSFGESRFQLDQVTLSGIRIGNDFLGQLMERRVSDPHGQQDQKEPQDAQADQRGIADGEGFIQMGGQILMGDNGYQRESSADAGPDAQICGGIHLIGSLFEDDIIHIEDILKDSEISTKDKVQFMEELGAVKQINQTDILLYELEGRYLYLCVEVQGLGEGEIRNLWVDNQGDFFLDTFPEVYREHGSFFHRYMSVFSCIYMDFQEKIDKVADFLDIDTAPAEILPIFCKWMGLDVSGDFLTEDRLRTLVREAYHLNRTKGTREALLRVCEIVLGEKVVILEKNVIRENTQAENQKIYEDLYGNGIYDVTLLVHTFVAENQKSQLMFLLNQFKPVRTNLKIKFLDQKGSLDGHVYMDMNAQVMDTRAVVLDERAGLDGNIVLKE